MIKIEFFQSLSCLSSFGGVFYRDRPAFLVILIPQGFEEWQFSIPQGSENLEVIPRVPHGVFLQLN